jgi:rhodanese-related sulfurtransferase
MRFIHGLGSYLALGAVLAFGTPVPAAAAPAPIAGKRVEAPGGAYYKIDAPSLASLLARKDFLLVNVHIPYAGEIAGTDAFIPFDQIGANLARLPKDKGAKVVLYCRSGRMSTIAAEELVKDGYSNILELEGGMNSWQKEGFPIVQAKR